MNPEAEGLGDLLGPLIGAALWDAGMTPPILCAVLSIDGSGAVLRYEAGAREWEIREALLCSNVNERGWEQPLFVLLLQEASLRYSLQVIINAESATLAASLRRKQP
ncbi:MAG: hypothetical protein IT515_08100 [Burkholderiales bacterium]|nr:hypothetical protein [Burkholderiales bacterium]